MSGDLAHSAAAAVKWRNENQTALSQARLQEASLFSLEHFVMLRMFWLEESSAHSERLPGGP